jgi:hypothetical protein
MSVLLSSLAADRLEATSNRGYSYYPDFVGGYCCLGFGASF